MVLLRNNAVLTTCLMLVTVLCTIDTGSAARPTVVPKNVLAQVGTASRFNCTAVHDDAVYWATMPYGSTATYDIYIGEKFLVEDYGRSGRFSVEVNNTIKRHDLIISNTKQTDGGVYICVDERGLGRKDYAELVVWDKLICEEEQRQDSYMGDNVFGLDQDVIRFTCRLNYTGNVRPHFEWYVNGRKLKGNQGTESGIVSSSLSLVATTKLHGANATCEAVIRSYSGDSDARTGVLWTSDTIRVNYAVMKKTIIKECPDVEQTLDCNPPCLFNLETINGTQRCMMNYSAGTDGKWFYFYEYSAHCTESGWSNWSIVTIASIGVFCSVCVLFLFGLLIRCFKINPRFSKTEKNGDKENEGNEMTELKKDPADQQAEGQKSVTSQKETAKQPLISPLGNLRQTNESEHSG